MLSPITQMASPLKRSTKEINAALAKAEKEAAALRAEAAAAEEAAASECFSESLERSLEKNLNVAHQDIVASGKAGGKDVPKEFLEEMKYDDEEEDVGDLNFWEHGVVPPKAENEHYTEEEVKMLVLNDGHGLVKVENMLSALGMWSKAFNDVTRRFGRMALSWYKLKIVYAKQRNELKEAHLRIQALEDSLARTKHAHIASEDRVVEVAQALRQVTKNPCGCKTFCSAAACGCRKSKISCRDSCGCSCIDCCNPASYDKTAEGQQKLHEALIKNFQRGEERVARRRESGY